MAFGFKKNSDIITSLNKYREHLMSDINLILRISDDKKAYTTHIVAWDQDTITFFAPIVQRDWVILDSSQRYDLYFISKSSMFHTTIALENHYTKEDKLCYRAKITSVLTKKQQREHFRLPALLNLKYQIFPTGDDTYEVTQSPIYDGSTTNISIGGMCMVTDQDIPTNAFIYIQLEFLNHDLILIGKILSSGETIPSGSYSYRIQFDNLDKQTDNLLSRLIFEKQRLIMAPTKRPLK